MRISASGLAAFLFSFLWSCSAPRTNESGPVPPRPAPALSSDGVVHNAAFEVGDDWHVGRIAGTPLSVRDFLVEWQRRSPREFWFVADKLVSARIAVVEAARLELQLDQNLIDAETLVDRKRQDAELRAAAGSRSVDDFLRQSLGFTPKHYYETLRIGTLERLVAERVVRAWSLAQESRAVRVIAVDSKETLAEVRRLLAEDASAENFAEVARALSIDDTASSGGYVPFLLNEESSPLSRLAFLGNIGEVAGPIASGSNQVLLRIEEARGPRTGSWAEVGEAVEASLAEHSVQDSEYVLWKLAMDRQHTVDLSPLENLGGTP